ncbi:MAG: type IV pilus twitching motility protein PilT [Dehalococcoidia bacterium]|nr:type IV pilus twitching motility protein PilT [Dehalococcoidia bacterium]
MDILSVVHLAAEKGASDVHLVAFSPPVLRIKGTLQPLTDMQPLTPDDINDAFKQIASDEERAHFERYAELDFGYTIPDIGRIRCNVAKQRGTISLVIRLLPLVIPTLDELGLPKVCKELVLKPRGLVVVSGPTGSGKSTTLTAMINYLNSVESRCVVTIEDPIEYIYSNDKCTITQRELGSDTLSFAEALKHVLRQDPNVILVGEMRDVDTAAAVLTIAETGHLVLTTGHAPSAPQTIERIIDLFPPYERPTVQSRLASLLVGILCQALIPKADGSGRIAAVEVMLASPAVRNTIREGKIYQLPNAMLTQARLGMVLLDQALINLYRKGVISRERVLTFCNDQDEVMKLMGTIEQS